MTSHTPLTLKNGKRRNNSKTSPSGIAARSELNGTFFEDDLELIIGRKKFLVYGEYAGGFSNFDRGEELDQGDEVDREVKDRISNNQWNKKNQEGRGHGVGPGFGNIGKGSESLNSDLVRFQKYKMTKSMVMYLQGENTQFGRFVLELINRLSNCLNKKIRRLWMLVLIGRRFRNGRAKWRTSRRH